MRCLCKDCKITINKLCINKFLTTISAKIPTESLLNLKIIRIKKITYIEYIQNTPEYTLGMIQLTYTFRASLIK